MKVRALVLASQGKLRDCGIENPTRDARLMLANCLGVEVYKLNLLDDSYPSEDEISKFWRMVDERCKQKPVSRIIGYRAFWGRNFEVNEDVLDPRGDTETLVEVVLKKKFKTMLELGTGSGAIAITVLAERLDATCVATDISGLALETAARNSKIYGVQNRLTLLQSDWFSKISGRFDIIVSNPPYISEKEYNELGNEVVDYDPKISLTPGGDGLDSYRQIISNAREKLRKNGQLVLEIGYSQSESVKKLLEEVRFIY
ncbi:MAG: peptide chain release factor N(5)-glutamine methyltransferase [Paracoccaceae bacterium]